ncbi:riboflavin synthase [Kozakia baliensis]|uniref:riboflavin synthase n=1 Tax=Kozakia baliensis TaxID=153496 RepID=UPI0004952E90|nr:riboflavin synthase [Kozakia baliensis]AOX20651.1 riboflavin synthase subunit alpha [Kozakia baliensis]
MFSGIIEHIGHVENVTPREQALVTRIATGLPDLELGESIAVNGVCLTVAAFDPSGWADFYISSETLDRTALNRLKPGTRVNLERATTPATRLSGHIVQGHVDGVGRLTFVEDVGESHKIRISLPKDLRRYIVEKGSIALDGISLTINAIGPLGPDSFDIELMIIPHTWSHTGLGGLTIEDPINVEVDVLGKYIESLLQYGGRS